MRKVQREMVMNATAAGAEKLRLKYPGEQALAFRDLTFSVNKGERILLLGPSGCGKSTLLQVLSGLIPRAVDVPILAERIIVPERSAFVFQDPDTQFCMPYVDEEIAFVLENLLVPREQMEERIRGLLDRVGLKLAALHTPISALSQGMKQRLAIACALALEPDVLFLDEPTALLDPEGTKQVWDTIRQVSAGCTVVIVEHKISEIADFIDRVALFNRSGELIADGAPDKIFAECRALIAEAGIWHPGVWDDFAASGKYARPAPPPPNDPLIRLEQFTAYRGKEPKLFVDAAQVCAGEWIAVTGPNGAGKSTLLLALMKLVRSQGGYWLNGRPADECRAMSDEIAFVFQNPEFQFVTDSVYDEAAFSLRRDGLPEEEVKRRAEALLAEFDLLDKRNSHPYQLSLGQKRRLSVASAIIKEQRILLLDEPTFGQDAKNTFALLQKLEEWRRQGTAIVMVTHDPDIVSLFATKVWRIEDGKLLGEFAPASAGERCGPGASGMTELCMPADGERREEREPALAQHTQTGSNSINGGG